MVAILKRNTPGGLRGVVILALCAVFFLLAMGLTLLGSSIYRGVVQATDENYTHRTALSYLANQVRRSDTDGGVAVGTLEGAPAILLTQEEGGTEYLTYLYCWDGALRELYMESGTGLTAADGIAILPLEELSVRRNDAGGMEIAVTAAGGQRHAFTISPRCGVKEASAG